jgi:D-glycero-D-manno-heptose 1,7-bisphosphate phosphatase
MPLEIMSKYIFLDRDGTIIKDSGYVHEIKDMEFLPRAITGLEKIQKLGYKFIIITNQAGIARGKYELKDAEKFNKELTIRLAQHGINIKEIYFCPHHPDFTENCDCRKPGIKLAKLASKKFNIKLDKSIFIGDKDSDIEFGQKCKGITIRIKNNKYPKKLKADFEVSDLQEAARILG